MSRTAKPTQMACLSIGYCSYLLGSDQAMKVMQLLSQAVECEHRFDAEQAKVMYVASDAPKLELSLVRADQVVMPHANPIPAKGRARPLRLTSSQGDLLP